MLGLWKATSDSAGAERRVYLWEDGDTKESLAKKVGLDIADFDRWAKPYPDPTAVPPKDMTLCEYSVPNVWISSDLLQGGNLWDRVVNIGGSIGRFIGTDIFTIGFKVIKSEDIPTLRQDIKDNSLDLWGMVVFGHGDPTGDLLIQANARIIVKHGQNYLDPSDLNVRYTYQSYLRNDVKKSGYKLAKIYMMQCYSAAGSHETEWRKLTNYFFGYKGIDFLTIDLH